MLKNLQLRNEIASVFAFRQNVIRKDLEIFDQETNRCAGALARYLNLARLFDSDIEKIILDQKGFIQDPHNEVFLLLRNASLRAFHLEAAIEELKDTQKSVDTFLHTL